MSTDAGPLPVVQVLLALLARDEELDELGRDDVGEHVRVGIARRHHEREHREYLGRRERVQDLRPHELAVEGTHELGDVGWMCAIAGADARAACSCEGAEVLGCGAGERDDRLLAVAANERARDRHGCQHRISWIGVDVTCGVTPGVSAPAAVAARPGESRHSADVAVAFQVAAQERG